jgi:hypothetical protein
MSGVKMIAFLNGSTTNEVSSQIYKFLDGKAIDIIKTLHCKKKFRVCNKFIENSLPLTVRFFKKS